MLAVKDRSSCYSVTELKVFSKEVIFMLMVYHFVKSFFMKREIHDDTNGFEKRYYVFKQYIGLAAWIFQKPYSKTRISLGFRDISAMKFSKDWNPVFELLIVKIAPLNFERISLFSKIWDDTTSYGFCNKV